MSLKRAASLCLLLAGVSLPAFAQDAGSLLREQQRREDVRRIDRLPAAEDEARPAEGGVGGPEAGQTIVLKDLQFAGKTEILPEAERMRIAAAVRGRRLGIAGIKAIADTVTLAVQKEGRVLAYAILPPQDITEGVVRVEIREGRLAGMDFERKGDVRVRGDRLARMAETIPAEGLDKGDLEAALLRMNDHPGVTARARLTAGENVQTSRLIVAVEQTPLFSMNLWGDNAGSASTGRAQANAQATVTDLSGYGDLTRLTATASKGQKFGQAAFSMPLGVSPFTVNANYGYLDYRNIDAVGRALGLEGHAHYAGLGIGYDLLRSREVNLRLSAGLNWKALVDDSLAGLLQDKRVTSGTLGFDGDLRDGFFGGGFTTWSLGWTFGDLDLSRVPGALAADRASLNTDGSFHVLNAEAARLQALPNDLALYSRVSGQWASKNLDSSQDFSLGGPYGVRGYPIGEGRGDMGVIGTLELRYDAPVPETFGVLQLAAFLDGGYVRLNRHAAGIVAANACGCNTYGLASAGLSARWARDTMNVSVSWAHALGANPGRDAVSGANADGGTRRHQFWLQGAIKF
ncbi:ShlB/FhaC/HecB family hemolysin secretion/activation protein [Shinella sp. G-2]|uniref:ShlB/FhaC/HecB family hemolysin secretion/activation protein n=1 Tax=Shinella sp. G-2 TaxID=3133141 RepID=UPI003CFE1B8F